LEINPRSAFAYYRAVHCCCIQEFEALQQDYDAAETLAQDACKQEIETWKENDLQLRKSETRKLQELEARVATATKVCGPLRGRGVVDVVVVAVVAAAVAVAVAFAAVAVAAAVTEGVLFYSASPRHLLRLQPCRC
jgi:hypothetical protein